MRKFINNIGRFPPPSKIISLLLFALIILIISTDLSEKIINPLMLIPLKKANIEKQNPSKKAEGFSKDNLIDFPIDKYGLTLTTSYLFNNSTIWSDLLTPP